MESISTHNGSHLMRVARCLVREMAWGGKEGRDWGGHDSRTVKGDLNADRSGSLASRPSYLSAGRTALEAASRKPCDLRMADS